MTRLTAGTPKISPTNKTTLKLKKSRAEIQKERAKINRHQNAVLNLRAMHNYQMKLHAFHCKYDKDKNTDLPEEMRSPCSASKESRKLKFHSVYAERFEDPRLSSRSRRTRLKSSTAECQILDDLENSATIVEFASAMAYKNKKLVNNRYQDSVFENKAVNQVDYLNQSQDSSLLGLGPGLCGFSVKNIAREKLEEFAENYDIDTFDRDPRDIVDSLKQVQSLQRFKFQNVNLNFGTTKGGEISHNYLNQTDFDFSDSNYNCNLGSYNSMSRDNQNPSKRLSVAELATIRILKKHMHTTKSSLKIVILGCQCIINTTQMIIGGIVIVIWEGFV